MSIPEYLACPECHSTQLTLRDDLQPSPAPFDSTTGLKCGNCQREFPRVEGIWIMWSDALKIIQTESLAEDASVSDQVKAANVKIYDEISDDYGEHHDGSQPYAETQLFLKAIADNFRTEHGPLRERVLVDVGCATGIGLDIGSNAYAHRVGVDISLSNLRAIAKKGYTPVMADAERLPFRDNSIDQMTCFATLHHFPEPAAFIRNAGRSISEGGVLLVACEPTVAASKRSALADLVWDARKPVYRVLSKYSNRYHLHSNREQQELNDLAEYNRGLGGFAPEQLEGWMRDGGFDSTKVFYGTDPSGFSKYGNPGWKLAVLKILSFQNPFLRSNFMNVTALGKKSVQASTH